MPRNTHHHQGRQVPKRVYVARTLVEGQPELRRFLDSAGRHMARLLGETALVATFGALHITILESVGTQNVFRLNGYSPDEVRRFSAELQQYLADREGTQANIVVDVDPDRPVRLFGRQSNLLALNILPNTALRQERSAIEAFLAARFGNVPPLRVLDEHIVFARLDRSAANLETQRNPEALLPPDAEIPARIALNGLMVFLNDIGDVSDRP